MVPSGFTMASTVAVWLMMTAEWSENVTCTSPSGRTTKRTRLGESAMAARREPGLAGRDSTADCSHLLALRYIQKGGLLPPPLFPGWRLSCAGDASASRCISLTAGVRLTDGPRAFSFYVDSHSTA